MSTDTWNPAQYEKFRREREQPFLDLLALVKPRPAMRIVDLGCGTGRPTEILHDRLGARETIGLDRSANMLQQRRGPLPPGLSFEVATIESFPGERGTFDLVFSNAALHWVTDHEALLARLAGALARGGQLAFQVPSSYEDTSHIVAAELTEVEPYQAAFGGWQRPQPVLPPEEYARVLHRLGFVDLKVMLIVYPHVLTGPEEIVEWMKGTLLTDYARHLPAGMFEAFVEDYRTRLLERTDRARPFFFPFKRILCWGQRA